MGLNYVWDSFDSRIPPDKIALIRAKRLDMYDIIAIHVLIEPIFHRWRKDEESNIENALESNNFYSKLLNLGPEISVVSELCCSYSHIVSHFMQPHRQMTTDIDVTPHLRIEVRNDLQYSHGSHHEQDSKRLSWSVPLLRMVSSQHAAPSWVTEEPLYCHYESEFNRVP